ncbi:MAG: DUF1835 domain-containing protein [Acidobacteriota bacterium]
MIYHVMPGDATAGDFKKTGIAGDVIVCRECLAVGPADADALYEFWEQRAHFILAEYGGDEIVYNETVADELVKLLDVEAGDEVNLWFEYELFCSTNLWFCLSLLRESEGDLYRIEPVVRSFDDRWKGFGSLNAADLNTCYEARTKFEPSDIKLGVALWDAYRHGDNARLLLIGETESKRFPYLKEVVEAAVEREIRPVEILRNITKNKKEFIEIFADFTQMAGVYGYGDSQVERLLLQMRNER